MKRTFACVGAAALLTMFALTKFNIQAIKVVFITAFVAFFVSLLFKKIRENGILPTVAFTVCLCCVVFGLYENSVIEKTEGLTDKKETHRIICEIVSLPVADNGRFYYTVKTEEIDGVKNVQKIRLSFKEQLNVKPFDRLDGNFHLYKIGSFSSEIENYYSSKGLFLGGYSNDLKSIKITDKIGFHPMYYILSAKQFVIDSISKNVPNEYGGLLTGFLLGEKGAVSEKTLNAFSLIGSYHLLAVSGLHITVWTGFVYSLLRSLKLRRKLCNITAILFILFFMAITGFNPPVVRAGFLMIFVFAGRLFNKEADSINSIGFAVFLMLLINPYSALSKSLWLSVFATLGIIILSGGIYKTLDRKETENRLLAFFKTFTLKSLAVSISVTLFTLPLSVLFFDRFSLVTPLANLVLIEITSFAMLLAGFAVLFFSLRITFVSSAFFFISSLLGRVITEFAVSLSKIPSITLGTDFLPLRIFAFLIPLFAVLFYYFKKKEKIRLIKITSVLIAFSFLTVCVSGIVTERNRSRIYIPSVGDGTSVVIVDKNKASVIGCGGNYFAYSEVCDIMKKEGVSEIEFLFVPSEKSEVYSFYDDIRAGYDIALIREFEFGKAQFDNGTEIDCEKDYAFADFNGATVLVILNQFFNMDNLPDGYASADYLIASRGKPINFKEENFRQVIINDGNDSEKTICLEVERNGRTGLKTAD